MSLTPVQNRELKLYGFRRKKGNNRTRNRWNKSQQLEPDISQHPVGCQRLFVINLQPVNFSSVAFGATQSVFHVPT
jgi:hypothetical protein